MEKKSRKFQVPWTCSKVLITFSRVLQGGPQRRRACAQVKELLNSPRASPACSPPVLTPSSLATASQVPVRPTDAQPCQPRGCREHTVQTGLWIRSLPSSLCCDTQPHHLGGSGLSLPASSPPVPRMHEGSQIPLYLGTGKTRWR